MDQTTATQIWHELQDGARSVIERVDSDRCRVLVTRENVGAAPAFTERERQIVELASRGYSLKAIACELGITSSTVSTHLMNAGAKLGLESRVAIIQMRCALESEDASVQFIERSGERLAVLSLPLRPPLPESLSPAEREVAVLVIAGGSNAQIAAARGVSSRTIANQVASAMRKLKVGARAELISHLTRADRPRSQAL